MLGRLFGSPPQEERAGIISYDTVWPGDVEAVWSGAQVSRDTALQLLAVYGCVRLITDTISTMPVDVFRKVDGAPESVFVPRWLVQPTPHLSFKDWCGQILVSLLLDGNAFVWVNRSGPTTVDSLIPLDPQSVSVSRESGRKTIRVNGVIPVGAEIVHIPGLMLPGSDVGISPVEYARQTCGVGLAALEYGAKFFDGDGNMPGVIEIPKVANPDIKKEMARQWRAKRTKVGKGLPGVLDDGATWKPTGVTNEQAQFLATRQWTSAEIAGQMFLVDPSELGIPVDGSTLTYQNLAQRGARLIGTTCRPWMDSIERAVTGLLPRPQYMKLNAGAWLRGDIKTQFETFAVGIQNEFMVPNEARGFMDWGPLPGGDEIIKKAEPAAPDAEGNDDAA
jgi:HK97 family phage portal protein